MINNKRYWVIITSELASISKKTSIKDNMHTIKMTKGVVNESGVVVGIPVSPLIEVIKWEDASLFVKYTRYLPGLSPYSNNLCFSNLSLSEAVCADKEFIVHRVSSISSHLDYTGFFEVFFFYFFEFSFL